MASQWYSKLIVLVSLIVLSQMVLLFLILDRQTDKKVLSLARELQGKTNGNDMDYMIMGKTKNNDGDQVKSAKDGNENSRSTAADLTSGKTMTVPVKGLKDTFATEEVFIERVKPACRIPQLDPFHKDAMTRIRGKAELRCPKKYFSKVEDNYLIAHVDNVTTAYMEYIKRPEENDNEVAYSEKIMLVKSNLSLGTGSLRLHEKLTDDFVKLTIVKDSKTHIEYHATVVPKLSVIERKKSVTNNSLRYNIAFLMLDSQSASNVKRRLRKVYDYLLNDEETFIFEGHSIVGDGTTAQLSAILTGAFEWDFPESRRGFEGGKPIDGWPFVFKNFTQNGYVTMFSEDEPVYAAFNYRLHGFQKPPTDHYSRPFWLDAKNDYYEEGICSGDSPIHIRTFDYLMSFHDSYRATPKFSMSIVSAMVHDDINRVAHMDDDLLQFLLSMKSKGHLENTIFILFGDHGARFAGFRETLTGKLEERLPFLSVTLPKRLMEENPEISPAMRDNTKTLTSFFDIHATLLHMLAHPLDPSVKIGQSLFKRIDPKMRACEAAGIKEHWCPCLQFTPRNTSDEAILSIAKAVVEFINVNITGVIPQAKSMCAMLELGSVKRAGERLPNERVRRFQQTSQNNKCIECDVILDKNDTLLDKSKAYEIVFTTKPGEGMFEASVTVKSNEIFVNSHISRLDKYGSQPQCIQRRYPALRKYCYCIK